MADRTVGSVVDRPVGSKYLLQETLGRGASGTVWRASVRDSGEIVAVKVLREELGTDPDVVTRFLRERSLLLNLRHPNLVHVRDLVVEGETLALVMDLIDGPDLRTYLRENGPLPPAAAALTMAQICDALSVTHADGVIHRDLKPANIMLARNGDSLYPMLTDFGIARLADSPALTRTHELVGTPSYVAPETAEGRPLTPAVDVYAAGVVLFELVAGHPPFRDTNPIALLHHHLTELPTRPAGMPDAYWLITERCLAKQPEARPDAAGLGRALRLAADIVSGVRPDDGSLARLLVASSFGANPGAADATRTLSQTSSGYPAPPPTAPPNSPDATRVMSAQPPGYPQSPQHYPPQPVYAEPAPYNRPSGPPPVAAPPAAAPAPDPGPPPPPPPPQRYRRDEPAEREPRRRERPVREPREREPREDAPRRRRGFRLTSIPGVGCTVGCLLRLAIMAAILFAIYWFSPLRDWVHTAFDWFDTVRGWYDSVKDFVTGGDDGGGGK
ncbi:serine/threonine-protein kinase [Embleya sp. NBC_00896]|uniref:serine/threonine-protein kinase n=1 Tax=Embleya sp. NBC_00896 TaxID=2975961 RepID=UPI00386C54D4|nr:serine/threonine protein kinase [Embleya sp. NBC_00896]